MNTVLRELKAIWLDAKTHSIPKPRIVEIPVFYGGEPGPDLKRVAKYTGFTEEGVIRRHCEHEYLVYFIGFSPGFPYIGGMNITLETPRLDTPRKHVPSGSVAIGGKQTGIYPLASPGGWNLIGQTPLQLFDVKYPENALIRMGDRLKFRSISKKEFIKNKKRP